MLDGAVREVALSEESFGTFSRVVQASEREGRDGPLTWDSLGLETMASLLVVSLSRLGDRFFEGLCQWPRTHPFNERDTAVVHHPLIAVESTRQLAVAVQHRHLLLSGDMALEMTSVNLGLSPAGQPVECGSATHVPVRAALSDVVRGVGGEVVSFRLTAEFLHRGQPFATCAMTFAAPVERPGEAAVAVPRPGLLHPVAAAVGAAADPDVLLARGPQGRLEILPRDAAHPVLLPGRPSRLPAPAVLEAGRQAVLLSSGRTGRAVVGLQVALRAPVPSAGAVVEVARDHSGARFAVHVVGEVVATGSVGLLRQ